MIIALIPILTQKVCLQQLQDSQTEYDIKFRIKTFVIVQ